MSALQEFALKDAATWPYLAAAAVLTDFAAEKLRPLGGGETDLAEVGAMLLKHAEPIRIGPSRGRWCLRGRSRAAALTTLKHRDEISAAITANTAEDRPNNPTQQAFDVLLASGQPPALSLQSLTELLGLERALDLAAPIVPVSPEFRRDLIARIEQLRLLDPLQRLLVHGFAGRKDELRQLRAYVDELEATSVRESVSRSLGRVLDVFRQRPPLVIWGPGGAGKSTLLAKFLTDHAGPGQTNPVPFIYLDFDRGQLDPSIPDSLLQDALAQIRIQFPALAERATRLRNDTTTRIMVEAAAEQVSRSAHFGQSTQLREEFARLLRDVSERRKSNVLLFIDTFEVVQRRGPTATFNVLNWVAELARRVPQVRTVLVGRTALRDSDFKEFADQMPPWKSLPLEGFDREAGRFYLQLRLEKLGKREIAPAALDRIVSLVRGNPLSLRLAAQVFAKDGVSALESAVSEAKFGAAFTQERLQGVLHSRIVAGLDEKIAKIADPGLIVRRLTPGVIAHVLAEPCGLTLDKPEDAEALFDSLAIEGSLFEPLGVRTLRHRSDVRLLMLPLLRTKLAETARTIDQAAVAYWSEQEESEAVAECIYHQLWLEADQQTLDALWQRGPAKSLLEEALDELNAVEGSAVGRIWLYSKLQKEIPPELAERASLAEWERHAEQSARNLLSSGAPAEALQILRSRVERLPASRLWTLEIETLKLLARDSEAAELVERAMQRVAGRDAPALVGCLLVHRALLEERQGEMRKSLDDAAQAEQIATLLGDEWLQFQALLIQTRVSRMSKDEHASALEERLARLANLPSVSERLPKDPALLREAAAELGNLRPDLLVQLSTFGAEGRTDAHAEALELIAVGAAHSQRGDTDAAIHALMSAFERARELQDLKLQARASLQLANVYLDRDDYSRATEYLQRTTSLADQTGSAHLLLHALNSLGNVQARTRNYSQSIAYHQQALELARQTADRSAEGMILGNLAQAYLAMGQLNEALQLLEADYQISQELRDLNGARQAQANMANALWKLGRHENALELYRNSLETSVALGDQRGQSATLSNLGAAYGEIGDYEQAKHYLLQAFEIDAQLGNRQSLVRTLGNLGAVSARAGKLEEAEHYYRRQIDAAAEMDDQHNVGLARSNLMAVGRERGRDEPQVQEAASEYGALESAAAAAPGEVLFGHETKDSRSAELNESVEELRQFSDGLVTQKLF